MLTYIIDAYNLLHKIRELKNSSSPQTDLVRYIRKNALTGSNKNRVILVFDGHPTNESFSDPIFEMVYSGDRSADDLIDEKLLFSVKGSQVIVVSNDNEVISHAKREGAVSQKTNDFLKKKKNNKNIDRDNFKLSEVAERAITKEMEKVFLKK